MAFSSSKSFSVLFLVIALLLPSFVLVVSSSESANSCNFDYVFNFGIGKTSVSSDGLVLPSVDTAFDEEIKGSTFSAPETYVMNQDFYLTHGLLPLQETSSSYLDSQTDHFLDSFAGLSLEARKEKLEHTLIIINHPGLMDYKHALQFTSELIVWDLVQEVVNEIQNALELLINAGCSNIIVTGLKPESLFGLDTLEEMHRNHLYQQLKSFELSSQAHIFQILTTLGLCQREKTTCLPVLKFRKVVNLFSSVKGIFFDVAAGKLV